MKTGRDAVSLIPVARPGRASNFGKYRRLKSVSTTTGAPCAMTATDERPMVSRCKAGRVLKELQDTTPDACVHSRQPGRGSGGRRVQ